MFNAKTNIFILSFILFVSCNLLATSKNPKILMVVTSSKGEIPSHQTGYWAEELVVPAKLFQNAGFELVLASPKGGKPPVDRSSIINSEDENIRNIIHFIEAKENIAFFNSKKLSEIKKPRTFDAIFIVGGHGVLWDLVGNIELQGIVSEFYKDKKIISAVCHGPAALVDIMIDSKPIIQGYKITAFSNEEETQAEGFIPGILEVVINSPLKGLLQNRITENGAEYDSKNPWSSHVQVSGPFITGQNPQSSEDTAKAVILQLLKKSNPAIDNFINKISDTLTTGQFSSVPVELENIKGKMRKNQIYSVFKHDKEVNWKSGNSTLYIGKRKEQYLRKEFFTEMKNHLALAKNAFSNECINSYLVMLTDDFEIAFANWKDNETRVRCLSADSSQAALSDANRIMDGTLWLADANVIIDY
ncbi:MAG: type 1 glutamine amidotransferase domain-containing protein [Pseudomonadota bacterium]